MRLMAHLSLGRLEVVAWLLMAYAVGQVLLEFRMLDQKTTFLNDRFSKLLKVLGRVEHNIFDGRLSGAPLR